jgi:hypothetical protein
MEQTQNTKRNDIVNFTFKMKDFLIIQFHFDYLIYLEQRRIELSLRPELDSGSTSISCQFIHNTINLTKEDKLFYVFRIVFGTFVK